MDIQKILDIISEIEQSDIVNYVECEQESELVVRLDYYYHLNKRSVWLYKNAAAEGHYTPELLLFLTSKGFLCHKL